MRNRPNPNMLLLLLIIIASTITPALTQTTHTTTVAGGAKPPTIYLEAEKIIPLDSHHQGFISGDPWGRGAVYIYEKDNGGIGIMVIRAYNGTITTENYTISNITYNEIKTVRPIIQENEAAITIFMKNNVNYTLVLHNNKVNMYKFITYYYYNNIYVTGVRMHHKNHTLSIYLYKPGEGYYRIDMYNDNIYIHKSSPVSDTYPSEYNELIHIMEMTTFYRNYVAIAGDYVVEIIDLSNMSVVGEADFYIATPMCFLPWSRNLSIMIAVSNKYVIYDVASDKVVASYRYSKDILRYPPDYLRNCPLPGLLNTGNVIVYLANATMHIYPVDIGTDYPVMDYRLVYLDGWVVRNNALYKYGFPVPYFRRYIILYRIHVGSEMETSIDTLYEKPLEPRLVYYKYIRLEKGKKTTHRIEVVNITGISSDETEGIEATPQTLFNLGYLEYPYNEATDAKTLLANDNTLVLLLIRRSELADTYYIVSYDTAANKTRYIYTLYKFLGYRITEVFRPRTYTWDPVKKILYVAADAGHGDKAESTYLYALRVTGANMTLAYTVDLGKLGENRWMFMRAWNEWLLLIHGYYDDVWLLLIKDGEIKARENIEKTMKPVTASWWNKGWLIGLKEAQHRYVYHFKINGELQVLERYTIDSATWKWVHEWYNKTPLVFDKPSVFEGFAVIPGDLYDRMIMPLGKPYLQYIDNDVLYTFYAMNTSLYIAAHSTVTGELIKVYRLELRKTPEALHVNGSQLYVDTYDYKPMVVKYSLETLFEKTSEAKPGASEASGGSGASMGASGGNLSSAETSGGGIDPVYVAAGAAAALIAIAAYVVVRRR